LQLKNTLKFIFVHLFFLGFSLYGYIEIFRYYGSGENTYTSIESIIFMSFLFFFSLNIISIRLAFNTKSFLKSTFFLFYISFLVPGWIFLPVYFEIRGLLPDWWLYALIVILLFYPAYIYRSLLKQIFIKLQNMCSNKEA